MEQPSVCCVMLTRDRPELARRAVECFRAQTYENKALFVLNTGSERSDYLGAVNAPEFADYSIGYLRNALNIAMRGHEIIAHWDDDDWSHPNRIAEQVALLQASNADVVGYNEMLFARRSAHPCCMVYGLTRCGHDSGCDGTPEYTAWLYSNPLKGYALGTSLCYWRKTWEAKHFPDLPKEPGGAAEDKEWLRGLNVVAISSWAAHPETVNDAPRMVARIHGANTMPYDLEERIAKGSREWKRVPEWDERVRGILA